MQEDIGVPKIKCNDITFGWVAVQTLWKLPAWRVTGNATELSAQWEVGSVAVQRHWDGSAALEC